jgi:hypothetical protein
MVRYLLAGLFAVIATIVTTVGMVRPWQGTHHAADFALRDLVTSGPETQAPGFLASVALPVLAGVAIAALGVAFRARRTVTAGWAICTAATVLWGINAADSTFTIPDMQSGFTDAAMAVAALLLAVLVLPSRRESLRWRAAG